MGPRALYLLCLGLFLPRVAFAQDAGEPPTPPPAPTPSAAPGPAQPPPGPPSRPPAQYYLEPPPAAGGEAPPPGGQQGVYEPPPPGYAYPVYEPPPPPKPQHRSPKTAFWLGPRVGWFVPFGTLWLKGDNTGNNFSEVRWSEYASSGPMFEVDVGMRFSRYYNVFFAWERAALGAGSAMPDSNGGQKAGETDYYAVGLRFSSDPDRVGFLTEIDIGYRRFRAAWQDGTELQLTQAPLEFRIGIGADIRVGRAFSLSPMVTLGAGAFGTAEWVDPNGKKSDAFGPNDQGAGHGWLTLQLGGHFDLAGGD